MTNNTIYKGKNDKKTNNDTQNTTQKLQIKQPELH